MISDCISMDLLDKVGPSVANVWNAAVIGSMVDK
jgi:hypothetical protein